MNEWRLFVLLRLLFVQKAGMVLLLMLIVVVCFGVVLLFFDVCVDDFNVFVVLFLLPFVFFWGGTVLYTGFGRGCCFFVAACS